MMTPDLHQHSVMSSEQDDEDIFFLPLPSTPLAMSMQRLSELVDRQNQESGAAATATLAVGFAKDDAADEVMPDAPGAYINDELHAPDSLEVHTSAHVLGEHTSSDGASQRQSADLQAAVVQALSLPVSPAAADVKTTSITPDANANAVITPAMPSVKQAAPSNAVTSAEQQAHYQQVSSSEQPALPTSVPLSAVPPALSAAVPPALPAAVPPALPAAVPPALPAAVPPALPAAVPPALPAAVPPALSAAVPPAVPAVQVTAPSLPAPTPTAAVATPASEPPVAGLANSTAPRTSTVHDPTLQTPGDTTSRVIIPGTSSVADDLLSPTGAEVFQKLTSGGQPVIVMLDRSSYQLPTQPELNKALVAASPAKSLNGQQLARLSQPYDGPGSSTSTIPVINGTASTQLTPRLATEPSPASFSSHAAADPASLQEDNTQPSTAPEADDSKRLASFLQGEDKTLSSFHAQMKLNDKGCRDLAEFIATNPRVRSLSLCNALIGKEGVDVLCQGLSQNKTIASINLPGNKLTDEAMASLVAALKNNTALTQVDLSCNEITDMGAVMLAKLIEASPNLKAIDLTHNQISKVGCQALAEAIRPGCKLLTLQMLPGNPIDRKDAKALVKAIQQAKSGGERVHKEEFLQRLVSKAILRLAH